MSERYGVATFDELATAPIPGQARWHTIRRTLGVSSFGVNAWTATEDGGQIIGEHEEASGQAHEELYVVVTGRATFTLDGEEVELTALEFKLLVTLYDRRNRVQSRGSLLDHVWGIDTRISTRTVDAHVKRLREKMGSARDYIETVRGVGYRFAEEPMLSTG